MVRRHPCLRKTTSSMKKLILSILICLTFAGLSSCTHTEYDLYSSITGTVVDVESGEPIAQATVTLAPGSLNTYTGSDGQFNFKDIDAQQYTITVQKTGYEANRKTIEAPSGETINVSITMKKL